MRVVDAESKSDAAGIAAGRKVLATEIANPSMSVMIVRGATAEVSQFIDRASARCDPFPWRQGVWVRKDFIFPAGKIGEWFDGHDDACAVILDLDDQPARWLEPDAMLIDIERAWLQAEGR